MTWLVQSTVDDREVHVVPDEDIAEHVLRMDCWCSPDTRDDGTKILVVHNAQDGREDYEDGSREPH